MSAENHNTPPAATIMKYLSSVPVFQHLLLADDSVELRADVHLGAGLAHPTPQDTRHQAQDQAAKSSFSIRLVGKKVKIKKVSNRILKLLIMHSFNLHKNTNNYYKLSLPPSSPLSPLNCIATSLEFCCCLWN